jgi:hypothetical protein
MKPFRTTMACIALAGACVAAPASGAVTIAAWRGHIALGYAKVVSDSLAPAGSMSVSGGVDYPLGARWRLGPALSINLLGSSSATRGSVTAGLDYSMFESALLLTYLPARGPVARWSFGPGLASPRSELSVSGGGAGFKDLPVGEVCPEVALDATLMSRHMPIVAIGAELGARWVPVSKGAWTLLTARLAIHY